MKFNEIFDQLTIFDGLDASQRDLLEKLFVICECQNDEVIFGQNEPAEYLYVVIDGEVAIRYKPDDGPELIVSRIKRGDVFGWSAAFGSGMYTSGASCTEKATLLRVRGADLKMLRKNQPETGILILKRLATIVAKRVKNPESHSQVVAFLEHGLINGVRPIGG